MAPENLKGKKRKVAPDSAPQAKKQKKSDKTASSTIPSTQLIDNAVKAVDDALAKNKAARKHADDFFPTEDVPQQELGKEKKRKKKRKAGVEEVADTKQAPPNGTEQAETETGPASEMVEPPKKRSSKSKKTKPADTTAAPVPDTPVDADLPGDGDSITVIKKKKKGKLVRSEDSQKRFEKWKAQEGENDDEADEVDDQTAALLAGFESEGDESDAQEANSETQIAELKRQVPEGLIEKLAGVSSKGKDIGVIFIGRIPHGFFERQMNDYFSQFGDVTRVRVSRNKKTGASKHYAFVEFANAEVADIVAKTMDKYLMFGRILQCKVIPPAQVHAKLFNGANRRFKIVPRNKLAGAQMKHGVERPVWEKRIAKEAKRREATSKKLKEKLGYEFEPPQLKSVDDVPKKAFALEDTPDNQLLSESLAVEEESEVKVDQTQPGHLEITQTSKSKKPKKGKRAVDEAEPIMEKEAKKAKKAKKSKKSKSVLA
ncbi:RNA-binding domain-containing protein [Lophiostoma macrostomum CBS 122681]|uniref:RNA-binding domain-containing protein n=1 Tax=Lophiostoma macrostomum CBS 122681 TaxID=1314788 RepID=A0A6A6TA19_9PLEO|nr:RNA-binding domain-containing protein [Lophiostoma macrostomum CBS 122681]